MLTLTEAILPILAPFASWVAATNRTMPVPPMGC